MSIFLEPDFDNRLYFEGEEMHQLPEGYWLKCEKCLRYHPLAQLTERSIPENALLAFCCSGCQPESTEGIGEDCA